MNSRSPSLSALWLLKIRKSPVRALTAPINSMGLSGFTSRSPISAKRTLFLMASSNLFLPNSGKKYGLCSTTKGPRAAYGSLGGDKGFVMCHH